jgi:hypothetical protein
MNYLNKRPLECLVLPLKGQGFVRPCAGHKGRRLQAARSAEKCFHASLVNFKSRTVKHARLYEHIILSGSDHPSGVARSPTFWQFLIGSDFWGYPSPLPALILVLPEVLWGYPNQLAPLDLPSWEPPGASWRLWEPPGTSWSLLELPGSPLEPPGASWGLLEPPGNILEPPGASWGLLEPPGASWIILEPPGASWSFLEPPGASWQLPGVSWSLLPGTSWGLLELHGLDYAVSTSPSQRNTSNASCLTWSWISNIWCRWAFSATISKNAQRSRGSNHDPRSMMYA